jgi:hypothetical protein
VAGWNRPLDAANDNVGRSESTTPLLGESPLGAVTFRFEPSGLSAASVAVAPVGEAGVWGVPVHAANASALAVIQLYKVVRVIKQGLLKSCGAAFAILCRSVPSSMIAQSPARRNP